MCASAETVWKRSKAHDEIHFEMKDQTRSQLSCFLFNTTFRTGRVHHTCEHDSLTWYMIGKANCSDRGSFREMKSWSVSAHKTHRETLHRNK